MDCRDPKAIDPLSLKLGIQSKLISKNIYRAYTGILDWSNHGICGRGVLLDMVRYWEAKGTPADPWTDRAITPKELEECAKAQGVTFRRGDILLLRVGFIRKYYESSNEEKDQLSALDVELCKLCVLVSFATFLGDDWNCSL